MQDRYTGDIGDFGKLGLLRALRREGFSVGVNWYLTLPTEAEKRKGDGSIRIPEKYAVCDPELAAALDSIFALGADRSIEALEAADLIEDARYYPAPVDLKDRTTWHTRAMKTLEDCTLVFLDPDNGFIVRSAPPGSRRSAKYTLYREAAAYVSQGESVVVYQHRCRKEWDAYSRDIADKLREFSAVKDKPLLCVTFPRFSVRDYFIICASEEHHRMILAALSALEKSEWHAKGMCEKVELL